MNKWKRYLAAAVVPLLIGTPVNGVAAEYAAGTEPDGTARTLSGYEAYAAGCTYDPSLKSVFAPVEISTGAIKTEADITGRLLVEETSLEIAVEVETAGWYTLALQYYPVYIRGESLEYALTLDSKLPFSECEGLKLPLSYSREDIPEEGGFSVDREGNELAPEWHLEERWYEEAVQADDGSQDEPYGFYLTAGLHTLSLSMIDGQAVFAGCQVTPLQEIPDYAVYLAQNEGRESSREAAAFVLPLEAEQAEQVSSMVVSAFCDSSSAAVSPEAENLQRMNALGGSMWSQPGTSASWTVTVPEDGWYNLSFHYRQDYTNGRASVRKLLIDGGVPFQEALEIAFPYTSSWKEMTPCDGEGTPYRLWLTAGSHTLTLEAALGGLRKIIADSQEILADLNGVYRRILTITGGSPDIYRDYSLDEKIPEAIEAMKELSERLNRIVEQLKGSRGAETGAISRLVVQLNRFYDKPEKIVTQLTQFQSNISALGTWIYDRYSQPLALDGLMLTGTEAAGRFEGASFWEECWHGIRQFCYSFMADYAQNGEEQETIDVWVPSGRDQTQLLKQLAEESFTSQTGINVNIRLVTEAALLPAVVAGRGPDVSLMCPVGTPVNFATRGAAYDLSSFLEREPVLDRFADSAVVPFTFAGGVYALPETLTFPVLFYRSDILEELGLELPETWDDVRELITDLNHNNMQFGLSSSFVSFGTFLFQNGGQIYAEGGQASALDKQEAIQAFEQYTQLYKEYKLPVTFDFANRFRSGEMPAAVMDYTMSNTLQIFAPEIRGLWDIAMVPGTVQPDGRVDRSVAGTGTGAMIIADTDHPEASWAFLSWWTSDEIQETYGRGIENKLGASARYPTANLAALSELPWSLSLYTQLTKQMEWVDGMPEVPGGYFTGRHFNNAFRRVVYQGSNARKTLIDYTRIINDEITEKRREFGLLGGDA